MSLAVVDVFRPRFDRRSSRRRNSLKPRRRISFAIFFILGVVIQWRIFTKAGYPGWAAIIPIYSAVVLCQVANKPVGAGSVGTVNIDTGAFTPAKPNPGTETQPHGGWKVHGP